MKAHHAINKLIASVSLHSYQNGGEVKKDYDYPYASKKGRLPINFEMFPEVDWKDDEGNVWTSNIKTALEVDDKGNWYLFPTMMGGTDLPFEGARNSAMMGKHFGVYKSKREGMKADYLLHDYFDRLKPK